MMTTIAMPTHVHTHTHTHTTYSNDAAIDPECAYEDTSIVKHINTIQDDPFNCENNVAYKSTTTTLHGR